MSDLLTPEEVREALAVSEMDYDRESKYEINPTWLKRLCRDYLTLWDRNKELEAEVKKLAAAVPHNHPIFDDGYYGRKDD